MSTIQEQIEVLDDYLKDYAHPVDWPKFRAALREIREVLKNRYGLILSFDKEAKAWAVYDPDKELATQGRTEQEAIESWIDGAILLIKTYRDIQAEKPLDYKKEVIK